MPSLWFFISKIPAWNGVPECQGYNLSLSILFTLWSQQSNSTQKKSAIKSVLYEGPQHRPFVCLFSSECHQGRDRVARSLPSASGGNLGSLLGVGWGPVSKQWDHVAILLVWWCHVEVTSSFQWCCIWHSGLRAKLCGKQWHQGLVTSGFPYQPVRGKGPTKGVSPTTSRGLATLGGGRIPTLPSKSCCRMEMVLGQFSPCFWCFTWNILCTWDSKNREIVPFLHGKMVLFLHGKMFWWEGRLGPFLPPMVVFQAHLSFLPPFFFSKPFSATSGNQYSTC